MDNLETAPILQYLNKKYGTSLQTQYYNHIRLWKAWWCGYVEAFHRYYELDGDRKLERKLYSMKMAKKVCEDWASILLNEKTEIAVGDKASSEFLQGRKQVAGVLGENDFWSKGNELVERAFYSGTGAFVLRLINAPVNTAGTILRGTEAHIAISYLDAPYIFPISTQSGRIAEAAFASVQLVHGKYQIYLEEHTKGKDGLYIITNELFAYDDGSFRPLPLPDGMAPVIFTGSAIPWFSVIEPNISNNLPCSNGMGLSVYANAIDELQNVDIAFNNFVKDFKLGGKKVFYDQSLTHRTESGAVITPDDMAQQLFLTLPAQGQGLDLDAKNAPLHEYNPALRVDENIKGIQAALDYLSFKCGLGTRFYSFDGGTIQTATQYTGERQDLVQNANKHYIVVEHALQNLVRGILYIGREFMGQPVDENCDIEIKFEDSYIIDKEQERERDRQDVRDGLMQKWEYRVKWYGESEEEAKAALGPTVDITNPFGFKQQSGDNNAAT